MFLSFSSYWYLYYALLPPCMRLLIYTFLFFRLCSLLDCWSLLVQFPILFGKFPFRIYLVLGCVLFSIVYHVQVCGVFYWSHRVVLGFRALILSVNSSYMASFLDSRLWVNFSSICALSFFSWYNSVKCICQTSLFASTDFYFILSWIFIQSVLLF